MIKIFETILEGIEWIVFAKWYKGSDIGEGVLLSLISGAIFIYGSIGLVIYWVYTLLASI